MNEKPKWKPTLTPISLLTAIAVLIGLTADTLSLWDRYVGGDQPSIHNSYNEQEIPSGNYQDIHYEPLDNKTIQLSSRFSKKNLHFVYPDKLIVTKSKDTIVKVPIYNIKKIGVYNNPDIISLKCKGDFFPRYNISFDVDFDSLASKLQACEIYYSDFPPVKHALYTPIQVLGIILVVLGLITMCFDRLGEFLSMLIFVGAIFIGLHCFASPFLDAIR